MCTANLKKPATTPGRRAAPRHVSRRGAGVNIERCSCFLKIRRQDMRSYYPISRLSGTSYSTINESEGIGVLYT